MQWLEGHYPHMVEGYEQLYADKYPPAAYRTEVKNMVAAMRTKYQLC